MNLWFALHDQTSLIFNGVNARSTPEQAEQVWGWSDSGSYLKMGIAHAKFRHLTPELYWTAAYWPPGMSYIYAFAIKLVGIEGRFIYVLATITAFLWAYILAILLRIFSEFMRWWIAAGLLIALIQTGVYHQYLVRSAIIWSDGYATGFLLLTIIFSYLGSKNFSNYYFVASGISLAALIYLRGQYFISLQILGAITALFGLILFTSISLNSIKSSKCFKFNNHFFAKQLLLPLFLITVVPLIICVPYMKWQKDNIGDIPWDLGGKWRWTSVDAYAYAGNWMLSADLAPFIANGGQGTACKVDKVLCAEVNNKEKSDTTPFAIYDSTPYSTNDFYKMTKTTLINHPIKWFAYKFPYLYRFWISGPSITTPVEPNYLFAVFSTAGLGILFVAPFLRIARKRFLIPTFLSIVFVGLTMGPPFLSHFEVRYLVPAQLIGLTLFLAVMGSLVDYLMTKFSKSLELK